MVQVPFSCRLHAVTHGRSCVHNHHSRAEETARLCLHHDGSNQRINQESQMKKILSPIATVVALSLAPAAAWADVQDRSGSYAVVGLGKAKTEVHGKKVDLNQGKLDVV